MVAARRPLLLLGLLLGVQAALAVDIAAVYGVCPYYTVVPGDSIYGISQKLGINQTDLEAAAAACGMSLDATALQVGQEICLPGFDSQRCEHVVETDPDRPYCQVYTVQPGDTLASIAKLFGISEQQIVNLNSDYLADGTVKPTTDMYLRLPGWNQKDCRDYNDNDLPMCQLYKVQQGDTLAEICQKFKVSVQDTLDLNNLTTAQAEQLPLNFPLKLPKWNESCPPEGIPAVLPSDTVDCRVTVLGTGTTIAILAERYGTTFTAVMAVNPKLTDPTLVQPGTYLNIPPFPPSCVGSGNLVDVPGQTEVPAGYDYNGLSASGTPPAQENPAPTGAPAPMPGVEAPSGAPPMGAPTPAAAPTPTPSPSPSPAAVPTPTPAPSGAVSSAAASLLAAALGVLGAVLLL